MTYLPYPPLGTIHFDKLVFKTLTALSDEEIESVLGYVKTVPPEKRGEGAIYAKAFTIFLPCGSKLVIETEPVWPTASPMKATLCASSHDDHPFVRVTQFLALFPEVQWANQEVEIAFDYEPTKQSWFEQTELLKCARKRRKFKGTGYSGCKTTEYSGSRTSSKQTRTYTKPLSSGFVTRNELILRHKELLKINVKRPLDLFSSDWTAIIRNYLEFVTPAWDVVKKQLHRKFKNDAVTLMAQIQGSFYCSGLFGFKKALAEFGKIKYECKKHLIKHPYDSIFFEQLLPKWDPRTTTYFPAPEQSMDQNLIQLQSVSNLLIQGSSLLPTQQNVDFWQREGHQALPAAAEIVLLLKFSLAVIQIVKLWHDQSLYLHNSRRLKAECPGDTPPERDNPIIFIICVYLCEPRQNKASGVWWWGCGAYHATGCGGSGGDLQMGQWKSYLENIKTAPLPATVEDDPVIGYWLKLKHEPETPAPQAQQSSKPAAPKEAALVQPAPLQHAAASWALIREYLFDGAPGDLIRSYLRPFGDWTPGPEIRPYTEQPPNDSPAHAGIDLQRLLPDPASAGFPRTRGDRPLLAEDRSQRPEALAPITTPTTKPLIKLTDCTRDTPPTPCLPLQLPPAPIKELQFKDGVDPRQIVRHYHGFGLNLEQASVVAFQNGPLVVPALAGSGKSRCVILQTAEAIDRGVSPYSILIFSMTKRAVKELQERFQKLLGPQILYSLTITTAHSFCWTWLKKLAPARRYENLLGSKELNVPYAKAARIGSPKDILKVILKSGTVTRRERVGNRWTDAPVLDEQTGQTVRFGPGLHLSDPDPHPFSSAIALLHAYCVPPGASDEAMREVTQRINSKDVDRYIPVVYRAYEAAKEFLGVIDFQDMITLFLREVAAVPERIASIRQRFGGRLITDESQDLSKAQQNVILALTKRDDGTYGNLTFVFDVRQSIFSFSGAFPKTALEFAAITGARVIPLKVNYRSTRMIVQMGQRLSMKNSYGLDEEAFWTLPEEECVKPTVAVYADQNEEAAAVAERIFRLWEESGFSQSFEFKEHAILARTNAQLGPVQVALMSRGLPFVVPQAANFFDLKIIKQCLAYLRAVLALQQGRPVSGEDIAECCDLPRRGLGEAFKGQIKNWQGDVLEGCRTLANRGHYHAAAEDLADVIEEAAFSGETPKTLKLVWQNIRPRRV